MYIVMYMYIEDNCLDLWLRVAIVTPTDHPMSVRKRCVIGVFSGVFVFSRCFLDFSIGVGTFVTRLNQISSFFSYDG